MIYHGHATGRTLVWDLLRAAGALAALLVLLIAAWGALVVVSLLPYLNR